MQGFHHRGEVEPPEWANNLKNYYWFIRVEGRDKAKRRKYYRKIHMEKLRLVEAGVSEDLVNVTCRYLVSLNKTSGEKLTQLLQSPVVQMVLPFK